MKRLQFEAISNNGKKIKCEALATYHDDETNKDYIIYTDGTINEEKKLNIFYSLYKQEDNSIILIDITNIEDEQICLEIIKSILKEV